MVCLKIIQIQCNYYDMGVSYGSQCKNDIHSLLRQISFLTRLPNFVKHILPSLFNFKIANNVFMAQYTDYIEALAKYYPEVQDLFKGIAHGSNERLEDIVFLNNMKDFIFKCSAWSACGNATRSGKPWLGMNSDEEKSILNHEIVLQVETDRGYKLLLQQLLEPGYLGAV